MDAQLKKLYDSYGTQLVQNLVREIIAAGKDSSGRLKRSIRYELRELANEIEVLIFGEDYLENVDKGRRPGSYPPISAISKWATIEGIPQKAVFPIARSIYRFGIKPTNVIQKALNKTDKKFTDKLAEEYAAYVERQIIENFKKK